MRILFMTDRYPPHYDGGYEINCADVAQGMRERGHETTVLTSMYGVDGPEVSGGVFRVMHSLPKDTSAAPTRRLRHFVNAYLGRVNYGIALDVIGDVRPELIFVWRMGHVSIFPVKAASDSGTPIVYRLGDGWLGEFRSACLNNPVRLKGRYRSGMFGGYHLYRMDFSNMMPISAALMGYYEETGFSPGNIAIIPPGVPAGIVSTDAGAGRRMLNSEIRLLYAGRITKEKGVHVGLDAVWKLASRLAPRRVTLDIVGDGPPAYMESLEEGAYRRGLADNVRFLGAVPHSRFMDSIKGYDALLFPSLWEEPFGMVIIEAMSQGLPVVASRVGGVPEIIEDMQNGMLVPRGDPDALADAVESLAATPGLAARLGAEGKRTVLERYTNERLMDRIERYLHGVLEEHKGADASVDRSGKVEGYGEPAEKAA